MTTGRGITIVQQRLSTREATMDKEESRMFVPMARIEYQGQC